MIHGRIVLWTETWEADLQVRPHQVTLKMALR